MSLEQSIYQLTTAINLLTEALGDSTHLKREVVDRLNAGEVPATTQDTAPPSEDKPVKKKAAKKKAVKKSAPPADDDQSSDEMPDDLEPVSRGQLGPFLSALVAEHGTELQAAVKKIITETGGTAALSKVDAKYYPAIKWKVEQWVAKHG